MLNFPCIETTVPIFGGNSGGPLLDTRGRICGVHCTSFDGDRISYHVPIHGILNLKLSAESFGIQDPLRPLRSVMELAIEDKIFFEPPLLDWDGVIRSGLRWLGYAAKCAYRKERPSKDFYFGSRKSRKEK